MKMNCNTSLKTLAALFLVSLCAIAQADRVPNYFRTNPSSFIFLPSADWTTARPIGTCFFVSVPDKTKPQFRYYYLVTAKHVITNGSGGFIERFILRNFSNGQQVHTVFELPTNSITHPYTHARPGVDAAVIPIVLHATNALIDALIIDSSLLATREHIDKFQIREGDDMFFMGLFSPFIGRKSNVPIFRFGRLAMLTDEEIDVGDGAQLYYLMDAQCYPGNSGSPAVFYFDARRNPNDTSYLLAGIVTAYIHSENQVKFAERAKVVPYVMQNNGITVIVPAERILEILNSPELKATRGE